VSSLEMWVFRKADVLACQSSVLEYMMKVSSYPWNLESIARKLRSNRHVQ
jgi:hypothetical protein